MTTIETIITVVTAVGGMEGIRGLLQYISNRKTEKRKEVASAAKAEAESNSEEWQIWRDQIDRMNAQIEYKDKRIEKLNQEAADKESRYIDQTKRLRESQDREYESQMIIRQKDSEILALTAELGELKLDREKHRCIKEWCGYKEPATEKTLKVRKTKGINPESDELPEVDPQPELTQQRNIV